MIARHLDAIERKPRMYRTPITILAALAVGALAGCSASSGSQNAVATVRASPAAAAATPRTHALDAADACDSRPNASGDIYVRMIAPGQPPVAQELGGEWRWNATSNTCQTSVQVTIATAPQTTGNCTQVGYVADNPGYDPNATPAAPLKNVAAESGPAC